MAGFGLPGGSELVIIGLLVVFLFAPGVLIFWMGYLTGKRAGAVAAAETEMPPPAGGHAVTAPEELATGQGAALGELGRPCDPERGKMAEQDVAPPASAAGPGEEPGRPEGVGAVVEAGGSHENREEEGAGDA